MTDMPGNPYYDDAESYAEDSHFHEGENDLRRMQVSLQRADLASQLALAYEQRTANLIEFTKHAQGNLQHDDLVDLNNRMVERMGLRDE